MKKILIIGNFGYFDNKLNGQSIKTRNLYNLFAENIDEKIDFFDTQSLKEKKTLIFNLLRSVFRSKTIIYLPAQNNLRYFFPILFIICKFSNKKIYYFVIGGWLAEFAAKRKVLQFILKRLDGIFVETELMKNKLNSNFGINNAVLFPNFRLNSFSLEPYLQCNSKVIRIVYFGRIHRLKGINTIFSLEKEIATQKKLNDINISIDIYGQIEKDYEEEFFVKLKDSKIVKYLDFLEPHLIYPILHKYSFMIFPTKYYTEGLPGSIVDAYISSLPVVATNWIHAEEFVIDGVTGLISNFDDEIDFIDKTLSLIKDENLVDEMKINARKRSVLFSSNFALDIINKKILNKSLLL